MKVFYTPVIGGQYADTVRMADRSDGAVYNMLRAVIGQTAIDELDERGWTKMVSRDNDNVIVGCWSFQQDDL